jgi:hypothetical protein
MPFDREERPAAGTVDTSLIKHDNIFDTVE